MTDNDIEYSLSVSMKSGLEGRNNEPTGATYHKPVKKSQ